MAEGDPDQRPDHLGPGMLIDAGDLDITMGPILKRLDHEYINDLGFNDAEGALMCAQPTVENMARYLWAALGLLNNSGYLRLVKVRLYENDRLWAEVEA